MRVVERSAALVANPAGRSGASPTGVERDFLKTTACAIPSHVENVTAAFRRRETRDSVGNPSRRNRHDPKTPAT
jgi:hypothetical protein